MMRAIIATGTVALWLGGAAQAATVYANNPAPGDSYTNAGSSNQGEAIGTTGWVYNNVRGSGTVGISDDNPRSGNGSVSFDSPSGSGKADVEFLASPVEFMGNYFASGSLGLLSDFTGGSYDWYRDGASTNSGVQHPSFRILLDADGDLATLNDRGGIVFERAYNGLPTLTDEWVTDTIGTNSKLWNFGLGLGFEHDIDGDGTPYDTLAEWQLGLSDAVILGFSSGVGSGWNGEFTGAVDNIGWTIGGVTSSTNFEVQGNGVSEVPLPGGLVLLLSGLGLFGLKARRRAA